MKGYKKNITLNNNGIVFGWLKWTKTITLADSM
jgi:hypothetical protein